MQTRSRKRVSPAEEQIALEVPVKPKKPRKRPAPLPKKISGSRPYTPPVDTTEAIGTPSPNQKAGRKHSVYPAELPPAAPPTKKLRRGRSTPPARAMPDISPLSPPETLSSVRLALATGTFREIEPSPTAEEPSRKRSVSAVDASADISAQPLKKKRPPKEVRFKADELTPPERLEEVNRLFEDDETCHQTPDGISLAFSRRMSDGLLKGLEKDSWGGNLKSKKPGPGIGQNEQEGEQAQAEQEPPSNGQNIPEETPSSPNDNIVITELSLKSTKPTMPRLHPKDREAKLRYQHLKKLAWTWTTTYFSTVSVSAAASLNLFQLVDSHPQLMEYANYISSCGPNTWESVFNEQCAHLVYGILGKMLDVHVFGCEMFGASEDESTELRELDIKLMNEDGFLRQRTRANLISSFQHPLSPKSPPTPFPSHFTTSLSTLHASFLSLLSPLLPSTPPTSSTSPTTLKTELSTILHIAATLSLSLRLSPDVIYYWQTHPAVGAVFDSREMNMLNPSSVYERGQCDLRICTMVGWPACVAYRKYSGSSEDGRPDSSTDNNNNNGSARKGKPPNPVAVGKAEVVATWGQPARPLKAKGTNWLGPRLRVEMKKRLEARDVEERKNVLVAGGVVGSAWVVGRPWFGSGLIGVMAWGQEVFQRWG